MSNEKVDPNVKNLLEALQEGAKTGGPLALVVESHLEPVAGFDAVVAPPRYKEGKNSAYIFERRFISLSEGDGPIPVKTVLLDSRESNANRMEEAIAEQVQITNTVFAKMPKIKVTYPRANVEKLKDSLPLRNGSETEGEIFFYDFGLPHRIYDGHIRFANMNDARLSEYKAARRATAKNAKMVLGMSPISLIFGAWDSIGGGAKFPAIISGEIYGVIADEAFHESEYVRKRKGSRQDPLLAGLEEKAKANTSAEVLQSTPEQDNKKLKDQTPLAKVVMGNIPPTKDEIDGVSVSRIVRKNVLSFSAARKLRFEDQGDVKDQAIRVLLCAMAINAMVHADDDLFLRANCQLAPAEDMPAKWLIRKNDGSRAPFGALSINDADSLLKIAYEEAKKAEALDWDSWSEQKPKIFEVEGNSKLFETKKANKD